MAASAQNNRLIPWGTPSAHSEDRVNFPSYTCKVTKEQLFFRTGQVAKGAIAGATTGAVIGVGLGLPGGPPGMAVGGAVGAGAGAVIGGGGVVLMFSSYDYSEFKKYRTSLSQEARGQLDRILSEHPEGADYLCAISMCIPVVPVRIRGEKQIYNLEDLEKHIKQHKNSPITQRPYTKEDITIAVDGIAILGKVCDSILNDAKERERYSSEMLKGIAILRKEALYNCSKIHEQEVERLMKAYKSKKISMGIFTESIAELGRMLNPVLGDAAVKGRVEYRDRDDEKRW